MLDGYTHRFGKFSNHHNTWMTHPLTVRGEVHLGPTTKRSWTQGLFSSAVSKSGISECTWMPVRQPKEIWLRPESVKRRIVGEGSYLSLQMRYFFAT
jgi:hypothetical protein